MIDSIASLVAFLKQFHRHWLDDPSLPPSLIPTDLPVGLATIYRELGGLVEISRGPANEWRAPFATQDTLVPLSRLKRTDSMAEFAWENQGNWSARCPLGVADPPVYSDAADSWCRPSRNVCRILTGKWLRNSLLPSRGLRPHEGRIYVQLRAWGDTGADAPVPATVEFTTAA